MTTVARAQHHRLDRDFADAEARDGSDNGRGDIARPRRWRTDAVSGNRRDGPRVLLVKLTQKTSAQGRLYLSSWMGAARLVAFLADEEDRDGNLVQVWNVYAAEPQPKAGR
jgi:hypothetical protein